MLKITRISITVLSRFRLFDARFAIRLLHCTHVCPRKFFTFIVCYLNLLMLGYNIGKQAKLACIHFSLVA